MIRIICHIFGYTKDQILAENDIEFSSVDDMYNEHEELNLGDIMSDAYVYAVENSEYYDGDPVDVAVVPSGTVREYFIQKGMSRSNRSTIHFHLELGRMAGGLSADQCLSDRKRIETCGGN